MKPPAPHWTILLRNVEVRGRGRVDVRVAFGAIEAIADRLPSSGAEEVIDGGGGALIPGLHDHHVHVRALAAARRSVPVGPSEVADERRLSAALRRADALLAPGSWLRAVGYHASVAGQLDRWKLDQIVPSRPVRLQERSGALWVLNSAALAQAGWSDAAPARMERDPAGRPNGRLHRGDELLRGLEPGTALDEHVRALSREAAAAGVTGFTDATPNRDSDLRQRSAAAQRLGRPGTDRPAVARDDGARGRTGRRSRVAAAGRDEGAA